MKYLFHRGGVNISIDWLVEPRAAIKALRMRENAVVFAEMVCKALRPPPETESEPIVSDSLSGSVMPMEH